MDAKMTPTSFVIQLPRQRRRAVELYSRDTPFRGRVEQSKVRYQRRPKHTKQRFEQWENYFLLLHGDNTSWWWRSIQYPAWRYGCSLLGSTQIWLNRKFRQWLKSLYLCCSYASTATATSCKRRLITNLKHNAEPASILKRSTCSRWSNKPIKAKPQS